MPKKQQQNKQTQSERWRKGLQRKICDSGPELHSPRNVLMLLRMFSQWEKVYHPSDFVIFLLENRAIVEIRKEILAQLGSSDDSSLGYDVSRQQKQKKNPMFVQLGHNASQVERETNSKGEENRTTSSLWI